MVGLCGNAPSHATASDITATTTTTMAPWPSLLFLIPAFVALTFTLIHVIALEEELRVAAGERERQQWQRFSRSNKDCLHCSFVAFLLRA